MKRSPFPVPFGWFQLGWPSDVAVGETKPLFAFDRHLVLWRDDEGVAHVNDAFCPHLGAHLGHGGKVVGCEIACPFHGWRFDDAGTNTLIPYSERVDHAVRRIRKARPFTEAQVKWLDRIAKQLKHETVVDRATLDSDLFKAEGGFTRLNKIFDGQLEALLGDLADETWKDAG